MKAKVKYLFAAKRGRAKNRFWHVLNNMIDEQAKRTNQSIQAGKYEQQSMVQFLYSLEDLLEGHDYSRLSNHLPTMHHKCRKYAKAFKGSTPERHRMFVELQNLLEMLNKAK